MDAVFKALADPTRRELLDELFRQDGQTLTALEAAAADDAIRRHEAPEGSRGRGSRGHAAARSREAPLPQPGPDPARPRPVGEQVRRALGGDAQRPQEPTGGRHHGQRRNRFVCRGDGSRQRDRRLRDLHQGHPRAHLGGHHGSGAASEVQLRRSDQLRLDARLRVQGVGPRRVRHRRRREPRGRPSPPPRSELQRAVERRDQGSRALPGSHGRSSRSRTRAGSPTPTITCPRARTQSSTAVGR